MWNRFNLSFVLVLALGVGGALLFVMIVDPLGISPISALGTEDIAYNNRRQAVPQIIRSGRYDSFVVGSSTTINLDPKWIESSFGGRTANVAIHGATPYEESRVLGLVSGQRPKRVLLGLDATWCAPNPGDYHPWWPFPEWLYDDFRITDVGRLLNWHVIRLAAEKLEIAFKFRSPYVLANGYETRLPKDAAWTAAGARARLYAPAPHPVVLDARPIEPKGFPAIALLRKSVEKLPEATELIVLFMPVHFSSLPAQPSDAYSRLENCKQEVAHAVHGQNTHVIDYMRLSSITGDDSHFWDSLHLRDAVAKNLVELTRDATLQQASSADGAFRYLSGPVGVRRP